MWDTIHKLHLMLAYMFQDRCLDANGMGLVVWDALAIRIGYRSLINCIIDIICAFLDRLANALPRFSQRIANPWGKLTVVCDNLVAALNQLCTCHEHSFQPATPGVQWHWKTFKTPFLFDGTFHMLCKECEHFT
jgi:hypothetical protein